MMKAYWNTLISVVLASFENDKGVWADSINHAAAIYFFFLSWREM